MITRGQAQQFKQNLHKGSNTRSVFSVSQTSSASPVHKNGSVSLLVYSVWAGELSYWGFVKS